MPIAHKEYHTVLLSKGMCRMWYPEMGRNPKTQPDELSQAGIHICFCMLRHQKCGCLIEYTVSGLWSDLLSLHSSYRICNTLLWLWLTHSQFLWSIRNFPLGVHLERWYFTSESSFYWTRGRDEEYQEIPKRNWGTKLTREMETSKIKFLSQ